LLSFMILALLLICTILLLALIALNLLTRRLEVNNRTFEAGFYNTLITNNYSFNIHFSLLILFFIIFELELLFLLTFFFYTRLRSQSLLLSFLVLFMLATLWMELIMNKLRWVSLYLFHINYSPNLLLVFLL